jgi:hypothetical protein
MIYYWIRFNDGQFFNALQACLLIKIYLGVRPFKKYQVISFIKMTKIINKSLKNRYFFQRHKVKNFFLKNNIFNDP